MNNKTRDPFGAFVERRPADWAWLPLFITNLWWFKNSKILTIIIAKLRRYSDPKVQNGGAR